MSSSSFPPWVSSPGFTCKGSIYHHDIFVLLCVQFTLTCTSLCVSVCVCVMQGVIYIQTAHALWRVQVRVSKCELLLCGGFRADLTEAFCIQNSISISNRPVRSQHHVLFSNRQILITCMHIFLIYIAYQILDFDMDMTERVYVHIEYASPYAAGF